MPWLAGRPHISIVARGVDRVVAHAFVACANFRFNGFGQLLQQISSHANDSGLLLTGVPDAATNCAGAKAVRCWLAVSPGFSGRTQPVVQPQRTPEA